MIKFIVESNLKIDKINDYLIYLLFFVLAFIPALWEDAAWYVIGFTIFILLYRWAGKLFLNTGMYNATNDTFIAIDDKNSIVKHVYIHNGTPHCKIHGAMNKVSVHEDGGGYWRCLQEGCRAGCDEKRKHNDT